MKFFKVLGLGLVSALLFFGMLACGSTSDKNQDTNGDKQVTPKKQKPLTETNKIKTTSSDKSSSDSSTSNLSDIAKKNYIKSMPLKLPGNSTLYDLTIRKSIVKNQDRIGFIDVQKSNEKPYKIVEGTKNGAGVTLKSIPSASQKNMIVYELGDPSSFDGNNLILIYTNSTLDKNNEVYFSRGIAMTGTFYITDIKGNKLKRGSENITVTGYWYKLKTNVWYKLYFTDQGVQDKAQLNCEFKINKTNS